jgi:YD repeat-containing protein
MTDPEGGVYRFAHDALGRRTHTSYPNGMTLENSYDAASRVLSMVYRRANREVIESFTYTYDVRDTCRAPSAPESVVTYYRRDCQKACAEARSGSKNCANDNGSPRLTC